MRIIVITTNNNLVEVIGILKYNGCVKSTCRAVKSPLNKESSSCEEVIICFPQTTSAFL